MSFFYMWGSFAGPVMAGPIYDHTQSYMMVLWILLILLTFATLLVLFLIRPWSNRMTALNPFSQFGVSNAIQKDFSRSLP